jgi:hypothetical protein
MSFELISNRPKLVDRNILKYVNTMKKQKYLAKKEIEQKEIQEKEIEIQVQSKTWYNSISDYICEFIKENYGFVLLFILIVLLLFIRYIECNKRKDKIKDIVIKYANDKNKKKKKYNNQFIDTIEFEDSY